MCWLAVSALVPTSGLDGLPVLPAPALPDTPATFTDTSTCIIKLKKLSVQLKWSTVGNASGYHLYRNGTLIATLGATVSNYEHDGLPPDHGLTYGLEAFNASGVSDRLTTTVSACK